MIIGVAQTEASTGDVDNFHGTPSLEEQGGTGPHSSNVLFSDAHVDMPTQRTTEVLRVIKMALDPKSTQPRFKPRKARVARLHVYANHNSLKLKLSNGNPTLDSFRPLSLFA